MTFSTLPQADLKGALRRELDEDPDLLPRQAVDEAANEDIEAAHRWLEASSRMLKVEPVPVVAVHKWRYGRRPVPLLPLDFRVIYRAVVERLSEELVARDPNGFETFQKKPVTSRCPYVVVTDLSNYYATIEVDRLILALLGMTGAWEELDWLGRFLKNLAGGAMGIPQGCRTSDLLADTYAELLADNLRRRGVMTWRFADDFRLGCTSRQDAIMALEIFDEETRKMGLYVNERKTALLELTDYEESLTRKAAGLTEAWKEARKNLTIRDIYSDMVIAEPTEQDVAVQAAKNELAEWSINHLFWSNPPEARIDLTVILAVLGQSAEVSALPELPSILDAHPESGRSVSTYLRQLSGTQRVPALDALKKCLGGATTTWQNLWLIDVLQRGTAADAWSDLPAEVRTWLVTQATGGTPTSGPAVLTMARYSALSQDLWLRAYESCDLFSEPYLVAAQTKVSGTSSNKTAKPGLMEALMQSWAHSKL